MMVTMVVLEVLVLTLQIQFLVQQLQVMEHLGQFLQQDILQVVAVVEQREIHPQVQAQALMVQEEQVVEDKQVQDQQHLEQVKLVLQIQVAEVVVLQDKVQEQEYQELQEVQEVQVL